jgi:hypothetical protein
MPGKEASTQWIGGGMGPRGHLDILEKRKISDPYRDMNPRPSSQWPSCCNSYVTSALNIIMEVVGEIKVLHI